MPSEKSCVSQKLRIEIHLARVVTVNVWFDEPAVIHMKERVVAREVWLTRDLGREALSVRRLSYESRSFLSSDFTSLGDCSNASKLYHHGLPTPQRLLHGRPTWRENEEEVSHFPGDAFLVKPFPLCTVWPYN